MSKRVFLITGAAGFVGANLCRRLVAMDEEVHIFVRPSSKLWRLEDILDRLHRHHVDLCDADAVKAAVNAIRPTVIYHLAAHGAYPFQTDGDQILLVNVWGLWNLVQACNVHGYELFVNTGSSSEYGRKQFAMRETDLLEPESYYAVAKAAQSLLAAHCSRMTDLPIVTLRLFSVYGPYEEPSRLIPHVMMAALTGKPVNMVNPQVTRDFVHVDDVVDVYLSIDRLKELRGEVLNVGTGIQNTLADVIAVAQAATGRTLQVRWGEMAPRPWDTTVWVGDVSKLRRLTGSTPRLTLAEGFTRSLPWFEAHQAFYAHEELA